MCSLFKVSELAKMVDDCIASLQDEKGGKVQDFSSFLNSLAEATGNDIFRSLFPALGMFGSEVENFQHDVLLAPMVAGEKKQNYRRTFKDVLKKGENALSIIKSQLCEQSNPDHKEIVKAIALLNEGWYILHEERRVFRPRAQR